MRESSGREVRTKPPSTRPSARLCFVATVLALSSGFHFGFQLVITNPAQHAFIQFLNGSLMSAHDATLDSAGLNATWSFIVAILYIGTLVGSFFIQAMADRLGRKNSLIVTTAGQAVSCAFSIISYFINSYVLYAISRFILGFFQAIGLGIAPMYLSEASPQRCRGVISLSTGLFIQSAIVIASIVAMPQVFGTETMWWLLYAISLAIFLVPLIFLSTLPESPAYLVSLGRKEEAERSIEYFYELQGEQLKEELDSMFQEVSAAKPKLGALTLLMDKATRVNALSGCVVMFAMNAGGIVVINGYAVSMLINVGLTALYASLANVVICSLMVVGCLLSSTVIDKFGRRPLLLVTLACLIATNLLIPLFMFLFDSEREVAYGYALVVIICVYALVYSIGPGPLAYFITAELVPIHARGAAMMWSNIIRSIVRAVMLAVYLPLSLVMGDALCYFVLFVPPLLGSIVFLYFKLPETKGGIVYVDEKTVEK